MATLTTFRGLKIADDRGIITVNHGPTGKTYDVGIYCIPEQAGRSFIPQSHSLLYRGTRQQALKAIREAEAKYGIHFAGFTAVDQFGVCRSCLMSEL